MATTFWVGGGGSQSWTTTANWSGGAAPSTGDTVWISQGSSSIDSGLSQSAVLLAAMYVTSGFTGSVGVAGDAGASLAIGTTIFQSLVSVGSNANAAGGFTRCKLDNGTNTATYVVNTTGTAADVGRSALQLKGGSTSSKLYVTGGTVDLAAKPGETAAVTLLDVSGGRVVTGSGATHTTIYQAGSGTMIIGAAATTLTQDSGTLTTQGTGLLGTVYINGSATLNHRLSGDAITTFSVGNSGKADFSQDPRGVLFTNNPTLYRGAQVKAFSKGQLQKTGPAALPFLLVDCGIKDVTLDLGPNLTVTIS